MASGCPLLHEERLAELARLSDDDALRATRTLFAPWRPAARVEMGQELVEQQRWFMRARRAVGMAFDPAGANSYDRQVTR